MLFCRITIEKISKKLEKLLFKIIFPMYNSKVCTKQTLKDAAVKEVEPKSEKAVEADIKEVAAAAKETVKDTGAKVVDKAKEVTKKVEKTVKEKVAEVKAAAADPEVYVQYQGNESNLAVITERIKKQYVEEGHKESDIKSLKIYLKPEDASAYYVINDNNSGKIFLF